MSFFACRCFVRNINFSIFFSTYIKQINYKYFYIMISKFSDLLELDSTFIDYPASHLNFAAYESQNVGSISNSRRERQVLLSLVHSLFLRGICHNSLSVYLPLALVIFLGCTDGCVRMHACKRRRQHASYVPRKRNPYTRAPGVFLSFSLIPLTQSTCP